MTEDTLKFKRAIKLRDRGPIATWLGDSQVWMKTAVEKDRRSGRGRVDEIHHHELNVAHVCTGLAFELAFKALAKSEGCPILNKHEAGDNYRNLEAKSQARIKNFVEEKASMAVDNLLEYLDERMCHPDRKYWMVGKKGEQEGVGFAINLTGLVIPDLAIVHKEIVQMIGENTFSNWQEEMQVKT